MLMERTALLLSMLSSSKHSPTSQSFFLHACRGCESLSRLHMVSVHQLKMLSSRWKEEGFNTPSWRRLELPFTTHGWLSFALALDNGPWPTLPCTSSLPHAPQDFSLLLSLGWATTVWLCTMPPHALTCGSSRLLPPGTLLVDMGFHSGLLTGSAVDFSTK